MEVINYRLLVPNTWCNVSVNMRNLKSFVATNYSSLILFENNNNIRITLYDDNMEFNLATWLRIVNFTDLDISDLYFWISTI